VSVSALVVTGCASCSQTDTTTASPADASVANDTSNPQDSAVADVTPQSVEDVHFIGRFDTSDPKQPLFAYPGTAISTRFTGTGIDVALADTGKNWFDVIVDNGTPSLLQTGGKTSFTLASNLAMGTHDVTIVKRTEGFVGSVRFSGFTPKGGAIVASPFPYARRIEMIGDSITCGYGLRALHAQRRRDRSRNERLRHGRSRDAVPRCVRGVLEEASLDVSLRAHRRGAGRDARSKRASDPQGVRAERDQRDG